MQCHFPLRFAGDIGQVLLAASLLEQLKNLDLSRQAFTGTLPSISVPTLETLNLADNTIQVKPCLCPDTCTDNSALLRHACPHCNMRSCTES